MAKKVTPPPFKAVAAFVSTLSPADSKSNFAFLVNTLSPANSVSPNAIFGKFEFNTLSPPNSLTSINLEYQVDGKTHYLKGVEIPKEELKLLGYSPDDQTTFLSQFFDSFLVSLLNSEDILSLDAKQLYFLKMEILSELFNSNDIKNKLKSSVKRVIKSLK
ncbi:hypothetical protein [Spirosoma areae]